MLLLPIKGQYEQMVNGRYIEESGLGISRKKFDHNTLNEFLSVVDRPLGDNENILWPDNAALLATLDSVLQQTGIQAEVPASHGPVLAMEQHIPY